MHVINRLPSPVLNQKSPFELLYQQPPILLDLKVFGSLCFASTLEYNMTCTKGYIIYDLHTRENLISRNVVFHETVFPYYDHPTNQSIPLHMSLTL